jgi:hypothetical protein
MAQVTLARGGFPNSSPPGVAKIGVVANARLRDVAYCGSSSKEGYDFFYLSSLIFPTGGELPLGAQISDHLRNVHFMGARMLCREGYNAANIIFGLFRCGLASDWKAGRVYAIPTVAGAHVPEVISPTISVGAKVDGHDQAFLFGVYRS